MLAKDMKKLIVKGKVYDLGQPFFPGMPHHPNHPPFAFILTKKHGTWCMPTRSARPIASSPPVGTRVLTWIHWGIFPKKEKSLGMFKAGQVQSYSGGLKGVGIDATPLSFVAEFSWTWPGLWEKKSFPTPFPSGAGSWKTPPKKRRYP